MKLESVLIGETEYKIRSLLDNQQFSDPNEEAKDLGISSALWPLFGQIWPTSRILAEEVLAENLEGLRILEIGCGLALPSIVLKGLGHDITASDYHPLAEEFLLENTMLNALPPITFERADWNDHSQTLGSFDLLIGSDVLYEENYIDCLSGFIDRHAADAASVIVVDPGRGSHRKFARAMEELGYSHTWTDLSHHLDKGLTQKGCILRFQRLPLSER